MCFFRLVELPFWTGDEQRRLTWNIQSTVHFEAKRGIIEQFSVNGVEITSPSLLGTSVYDVNDWAARLRQATENQAAVVADAPILGAWMDGVLGTHFTKPGSRG